MTNRILFSLGLLLGALWIPADAKQENPLVGEWIGGYELNGTYTLIKAQFKSENEMKGTLDLPIQEETGVTLNQVKFRAPDLSFELPRTTGAITFAGKISGDTVTGNVGQRDERGTFHLVRTVTVDPKVFDRYVGDYQLANGKYISIERSRFPMDGINFVESESHRFGRLFPTSETAFFAGAARLVPHPVEINVTFVKNKAGEVMALKWKLKGSAEKIAQKVKLYNQEEVKFHNGNVMLAGTLTLPLTKAPHAAVVLIHGSDPNTRFDGTLPRLFALHGIAALTYDKRGAGASTGDLRQATFDDLAGDAAAGVRFLQTRRDINPQQVGLWAISQGGWIAPLVATRTPDVAFMILHAGPAVTPKMQARMELENTFLLRGFTPAEIKEAAAYQTLYFDAMKSDEAWEKLQATYEQARAQNARWVWNPGTKERLQQQWFRLIMDFDPLPVLEKVKIPVLAFFGEKDVLVPPAGNVSIMEQALKNAGNKDFTIKILPRANHRFEEIPTAASDHAAVQTTSSRPLISLFALRANEYATVKKTVPGYYETMFGWLNKRVDAR